MKLAYLINEYPKVSHSFIRREIRALERAGFQVQRISLRGWASQLPDPEDQDEQSKTHFILRNGSDHTQVDDKPAELTQLGGTKPVVPHAKVRKVDVPAQVTPIYTVQTVAGDKQTTESFK